MKKYAFLIALAVFTGYSCQKTVTLPLKSSYPHIVIQGEVTDTTGPYTVTINQTVDFYAENNFPAVSGAVVKIHDDKGNVDSLIETAPGVYSTQTLVGHPGNTYTLTVLAKDTLYTASSTMPVAVPFDSITFDHDKLFGTQTITAIVNFQDPPGVNNYYQFQEYVNGKFLNQVIFAFDDRLSDGRYISRQLRNDSSRLALGNDLKIKMYCIDKPVFDYFNQLEESGTGGNFNSAAPADPTSNFDNGALGYFSAHTLRSRETVVY